MEYRDLFRGHGMKCTPSRLRVYQVLEKNISPLGAQEIFEIINREEHVADLSTVYRILNAFVQQGMAIRTVIDGDDRALYEAWWSHPAETAPPEGESINQVNERCRQAWKEIKPQLTGDAAIVAHGGLLAHFMEQLLGSESIAASTVAHNASITTIEYEPETERFVLVEFDDYKHLL